MAASLSGVKGLLHLSGRKKESCIWDYFKYDMVSDLTTCMVDVSPRMLETADTAQTGNDLPSSKCGRKLSGKNPTNLKTHLRALPVVKMI